MTVTATHRVSGPFTCDGSQKTFSFDFKVFAASDVAVAYGDPEAVSQTTLSLNTDFSVSLNSDQDESPGGSVTTVTPPPKGMSLSITSKVDATQEMQLTNQGGFYPTVINSECDKLTILIQQLNEQVKRCVKTSTTTAMTPGELTQKLLSAADTAYTVAKSYADAAGASAAEAAKSEAAAKASESAAAGSATASAASASASGNSASESASSASASAASAKEAAATVAGAKQEISDAKDAGVKAVTDKTAEAEATIAAGKSDLESTISAGKTALADAKTDGVSAVEAQAEASSKSAAEQIKAAADAQAERLSKITEAVVEQESHVIDDASSPQSFAVGNVSHVLVFIDSVLAVEGQSYGITGGDTVQFADALPVGTEVTLIKFVSAGAAAITPSYAIDSVLSDTSTNAVQNRIVKAAIADAVKTALLSAHPVGSIYCSVVSTDPATLFGGTWERIAQGRVLWGADAAHSGGDTIEAGLPNITGGYLAAASAYSVSISHGALTATAQGSTKPNNSLSGAGDVNVVLNASKSSSIYGNSSTVQPPAYVVFMWRRTA